MTEVQPINVQSVLRIMWQGVKPWKWMFFTASSFQVLAVIVFALVPINLKKFFDLLSSGDTTRAPELVWIVATIFLAQVFRRLLDRVGVYIISVLDARAIPRLMQIAYDHTLGHSAHFFENAFAGALVQKVRRLASAFRVLMESYFFEALPVIAQIGTALVVTYFFQPLLSLLILVWVVIFVGLNYILALKKVALDVPRSALDSRITATLADSFSNISAIITYATAPHESKRFKAVTDEYGEILLKSWVVSITFIGIFSICIFALEFAVYYLGIQLWAAGAMTVGTFVLIQIYIIQLSQSLWGLGELIRKAYESFSESMEVVEILDAPHGVSDVLGAQDLVVKDGSVEYRNVVFAYNETREVLSNISVTIPGGQKIAMIGPSGAGKSTLVRLLLRTYDTTDGEVLVDGQCVARVTQDSLRRAIAFVPQDPSLFHRTLRENIRYGRPDATNEEVIEAARRAHCHEFIKDLQQGYDTLVGERGVKLSGGERQRVAIARAILKNAPILILDEATSSLDSESESLIQKALDELMKDKTVIVIAHRLSTIRKMDRILVVQGGRIAEDGSHHELLKNDSSLYKQLWELQAGGFIVEKDESNV